MIKILFLLIFIASNAIAYTPSAGIPNPNDHWGGSYDPIETAAPARPDPWTEEQAGYYYVDAAGNDSGRTYGTPSAPRLTIPTTLSAGAYVEVHGDFNTSPNITCNGESASPVWIVGLSGQEPTFNAFTAKGTHFIIERINIDTTTGFAFGAQSTYGTFRNSTIDGPGTEVGSNGSGIGFDGADNDNRNTYLLVYNCTVKDLGLWTSDSAADFHGAKPRYYSSYIWILNNTMYHLQGDSVQTGEASGTYFPQYIYIGSNTMYENKENCIDIKDGDDIIISGNICYNMDTAHGDDEGAGIVLHEDTNYCYVINNIVHDCSVGIINTQGSNIFIIGNLVYNIDGSTNPVDHYGSGVGIHLRGTSTAAAIVNNTVYNADKGIQLTAVPSGTRVRNNLISNGSDADAFDIMAMDTTDGDFDYGLVYRPSADYRVYWGSTTYTSLAAFIAGTTEGDNCQASADPKFVSAGSNFALQSDSPAIGYGEVDAVYADFFSRYGLSIAKDIAGTTRPQGGTWDIGAYEYTESTGTATIHGGITFSGCAFH